MAHSVKKVTRSSPYEDAAFVSPTYVRDATEIRRAGRGGLYDCTV